MPIYEYKCDSCGLVQELIQPWSQEHPKWKKCINCGSRANEAFIHGPAMIHSDKAAANEVPFDVAVGRDAEARWADIKHRQKLRDKVRRESGAQGLTMTGRNEFQPIKDGKLEIVEVANGGKDEAPTGVPLIKRK